MHQDIIPLFYWKSNLYFTNLIAPAFTCVEKKCKKQKRAKMLLNEMCGLDQQTFYCFCFLKMKQKKIKASLFPLRTFALVYLRFSFEKYFSKVKKLNFETETQCSLSTKMS